MTTQTWNIDHAHSALEFTVRHMMFSKVRGRFARWTGTVELDAALESGHVVIEVDVASIETGNTDRDAHLRSADFFDAERVPTMRFESRRIHRVADDQYALEGELTIRDVTRPVTLVVEHTGAGTDPWGQHREGFHATAAIDRKAFGLTWNQALEAGGVLVGDKVAIGIELQLVRASMAEAA